MDFFNNLLRGAQGVGQNLLNRVGSIQTPINSGSQGSQKITLGDIGNNLGNAYNQVANATQFQRQTNADRSVPIFIQDPKTGLMVRNPNQTGANAAIDLAGGSMGGESKFAGIIGDLAKSKTVQTVQDLLTKQFGPAASKIGSDVVSGLQKTTDPGQIAGLLKQAGAMVQMHTTPIADATRSTIVNELHSIGEHNAANLANQAQTHGDIIDALKGTQLHPEAPVSAPYNIHPTTPLHPDGTPLSGMAPSLMAHAQDTKATNDINILNMNKMLQEKQAAQTNNQMPQASSLMAGKIDQLKARQADYKTKEAGLSGAELVARDANAPSPHEMKQMDANAAIPKPPTEPITIPPRVPEPVKNEGASFRTIKNGKVTYQSQDEVLNRHAELSAIPQDSRTIAQSTELNDINQGLKSASASRASKMAPNQTGSAHANQGVPKMPTGPTNLDSLLNKTPETKPLLDNQTGSAHSNQGEPMARPETASSSHEAKPAPATQSAPALVHRGYDANGNVDGLTHTGTGENVKLNHDGSPISNYTNELLHETKGTAYGTSGHEVSGVHEGRQKALEYRQQAVNEHLNTNFTAAERTQITHLREGSIKPADVSPKVEAAARQLSEMDRAHYLLNKEANGKTGEINNGSNNYVQHINLDKTGEKSKLGLGKFSLRNSTQKGREIVKLTPDKAGKAPLFGNPNKLGMIKQGDGTYIDKFGNKFHAGQATLMELNNHGMHYETDAAKIAASSMSKVAKTANNAKLGRNLTTSDHGKNIIARMPSEKTPPKGYVESHIPGMQEHWMSKAYHDHLYTNSDVHRSLGYKAVQLGGKVIGLPSRVINNAFFAENSMYHQLINEAAQGFTTAGAGAGKSNNFFKEALRGIPNAGKTAKLLGEANKSVVKHDESFYAYLRAGGKTSQRADGASKALTGALGKLKSLGHAANLTGRMGHAAAVHIGDTIRMAKFKQLTTDGMTAHDAVKLIDKVQGDYSNLNRFEKEIVTNYVQFYPFFKHQLTSLLNTGVGAVRQPGMYAGAAVTAALTYAGYTVLDKGLQALTGNQYADIKKGGMLGLIDDVRKAPQQLAGYTDKAGVKHPGVVPSIVSNRLNPVERIAAEQSTGKSLTTNMPFDTSASGRTFQAAKAVSETGQGVDLQSGKKTLPEIGLNMNGIKLSHGMNTQAAPNLNHGILKPIGDMINSQGHDSAAAMAAAEAAKKLGGSKLASYQYARLSGDNSLDKFWQANPTLDPNNSSFKGFTSATGASNINAGKNLIKSQGGSSLAYMQALKASGSSQYDKFFKDNPTLDPTNPGFQAKPSSSQKFAAKQGKSQAKYATKNAKFTQSKAAALAHIGTKGASKSVSIPGMKHANLRTAMRSPIRVTKFAAPKMSAPGNTKIKLAKITTPTKRVGLSLKA